mmetsp:Transcript_14902/g.41281  ORF Transcript_14902/g.41281 Transcript_14902/m.41281 type:complete len:119 (-) Transcript_14902:36-392(-)
MRQCTGGIITMRQRWSSPTCSCSSIFVNCSRSKRMQKSIATHEIETMKDVSEWVDFAASPAYSHVSVCVSERNHVDTIQCHAQTWQAAEEIPSIALCYSSLRSIHKYEHGLHAALFEP